MTDLSRLRRFLGLTQLDVSLASGITVDRISKAERELVLLTETEKYLVFRYLEARLRIAGVEPRADIKQRLTLEVRAEAHT